MPNMFAKTWEWSNHKQSGDVSISLRITMFLRCFQKLAQRARKLQLEAKDDALIQNLRSKGILAEDNK